VATKPNEPNYNWLEEAVANHIMMDVQRVREVIDTIFYKIESNLLDAKGSRHKIEVRRYGYFYVGSYPERTMKRYKYVNGVPTFIGIGKVRGGATLRFCANERVRKNVTGGYKTASLRPAKLSIEKG